MGNTLPPSPLFLVSFPAPGHETTLFPPVYEAVFFLFQSSSDSETVLEQVFCTNYVNKVDD